MDDLRDEVLIRHLVGIASPGSVVSLQRWMEEDPAFGEHVARVRAAWEAAGVLVERHDSERGLERVMMRINRNVATAPPDPRSVARSSVRTARRRPGAAPAQSMPRLRRRRSGGKSPARSTRSRVLWLGWVTAAVLVGAAYWAQHVLLTPELITRTTIAGQRAAIRLSDGSEVLLGPETELQFPRRFRGRSREVRLRGSAYFNISRDERRPFTVHAAGTVTQVLGTRFLVRAYDGDADVEVAVAEGRVTVQRDTAPETEAVVVSGGQLARVPEDGTAKVIEDAEIDALLGWTQGRIVFSARPLPEVLRELERWYGRTIRIAETSLRERRVTLSFEDASLDEVLEVLAASLELRVEHEAGGVAVYDATATRRR